MKARFHEVVKNFSFLKTPANDETLFPEVFHSRSQSRDPLSQRHGSRALDPLSPVCKSFPF